MAVPLATSPNRPLSASERDESQSFERRMHFINCHSGAVRIDRRSYNPFVANTGVSHSLAFGSHAAQIDTS